MSATAVMTLDALATRARERTALDDFGGDSWRDGLVILVDTLEHAPGVNPAGRSDLYRQFVDALVNRLRVVDYAKQHPALADTPIDRPLVILGLPRTGTTVASCLLDADPKRRSLLNWEAADSVPPAPAESLRTDPRCLAKKAELDEFAAALEAAQTPIPHWEDADGPTECTFVQNQDFKAFLWDAFMPTPAYGDWLLRADMTSAYRYERTVLQILQSDAPGVWSLKMPSHGVHIEALLTVFPDARIVWAHRDPFKATASLLSMNHLAKSMIVPEPDIPSLVASTRQQLQAHVERPLAARRRIGDDRFFDLHYAALMRDPIGRMKALYDWAGDELTRDVEAAMVGWLQRNPQHRFGVRPYSLDAYGLTVADLQPDFDEYLSKFDIELEGA
jgi:sulfotransferase family protein